MQYDIIEQKVGDVGGTDGGDSSRFGIRSGVMDAMWAFTNGMLMRRVYLGALAVPAERRAAARGTGD